MKGIVAWFIDNPIAANLLMALIVVGGLFSFDDIDKEFFPEQKLNQIQVIMAYPGAGPKEVEKQLCIRIEEAISDLEGVDEINATAIEGMATVLIDVDVDYDRARLLNEVKSRIDGITTFPVEAERPQVTELSWKTRMISVALAGDISEVALKELGERIREEMAALPQVAQVDLREPRPYEMSIEVSEFDLRRYGLRIDDVAAAVRSSSLNLPAGKIRAEQGDIQLQTRAQGYVAADFEDIVLIRNRDGTQVTVGDVATVRDDFAELDVESRFNDKPSLSLDVYVSNNPDILKTSRVVNAYIERVAPTLPPTVELRVWRDMSLSYQGRMNLLISNGLTGLLLVFVVLMLFLRPALALWVCTGIAIAFMGAFWLMPITGISLNMVSLFAFIMILGIIVDDAIIVGESVYQHQQRGELGALGALNGTKAVIAPVWFAVISTMLFFAPMYFVAGHSSASKAIALVVILALSFSLLEAMTILPSHLAGMKPERTPHNPWLARLERIRLRFVDGLTDFARDRYRPALEKCLRWRGVSAASFAMALSMSFALLAGGWLEITFFPRVPADFVAAMVTLPDGVAYSETRAVLNQVESAADRIKAEYNREEDWIGSIEAVGFLNTVRVTMELRSTDAGRVSAAEVKQRWSDEVGAIAAADDVTFTFTAVPLGKPITFMIAADDTDMLRRASAELSAELASFAGVYNVRDSLDSTRPEIELRLKPQANTLELTLADLAQQVRRGFYGEEVQRIPRPREDVKVMVRYPVEERASEDFLRQMRVRTPAGDQVPFETVAEVAYVPSYSKILRRDRMRVATISADLQPGHGSASAIIAQVIARKRADLEQRYPGLRLLTEGEEAERAEFMGSLEQLFGLAMLALYGLLAVGFRSYSQPLLIMSVVPFGFMGAILGHLLMGLELSMFSLMGMFAAAGVVVNDNLVLIDRINQLRASGVALFDALLEAGQDRFRPILLTSMTTVIGMAPIMLETSTQARFLIPMVTSLAFGVALATVVTLFFTPVLYLSMERGRQHLLRWFPFLQRASA